MAFSIDATSCDFERYPDWVMFSIRAEDLDLEQIAQLTECVRLALEGPLA